MGESDYQYHVRISYKPYNLHKKSNKINIPETLQTDILQKDIWNVTHFQMSKQKKKKTKAGILPVNVSRLFLLMLYPYVFPPNQNKFKNYGLLSYLTANSIETTLFIITKTPTPFKKTELASSFDVLTLDLTNINV